MAVPPRWHALQEAHAPPDQLPLAAAALPELQLRRSRRAAHGQREDSHEVLQTSSSGSGVPAHALRRMGPPRCPGDLALISPFFPRAFLSVGLVLRGPTSHLLLARGI